MRLHWLLTWLLLPPVTGYSVSTMTVGTSCAAQPDCAFIQANIDPICSTLLPGWDIVNGPSCSLQGMSYGCVYSASLDATDLKFCVPATSFTATSTVSRSVHPSISSSRSVYPSGSPSRSTSVSASVRSSGSPSRSAYPSASYGTAHSSVSSLVTATVPPPGPVLMCATPAYTVTTSLTLITNAIGTLYSDNMNCVTTVNAGTGYISVNFLAFSTEGCCDSYQIRDARGATVFAGSGQLTPDILLVSTPATFTFTTDPSVTFNGVNVLIAPYSFPTSTMTLTASTSPFPSVKTTAYATHSASPVSTVSRMTGSARSTLTLALASLTALASITARASETPWPSDYETVTASASPSYPTSSACPSFTSLPTSSGSPSHTTSPSPFVITLPNLKNLSTGQLKTLFQGLSAYPPNKIKGLLNTLTSAALTAGNGSFSVQTDAFALQSKTLSAKETMNLSLLSLPPLGLPSGSFASIIKWTSNPYDNSNNPVVSVSALSQDAQELAIHSLATPFTTRWPMTSQSYTFLCGSGQVYANVGGVMVRAPNVTRVGKGLGTWSVLCGSSYVNVSCPIETYTCPPPSASCAYWNTSLGTWASDGCVSEYVGNDLLCHCTHMTDFSVRLQAVVDGNKQLFSMASSVYSEEGLKKYAQWYSIFGSLTLFAILLVIFATQIDYPIRKVYVDQLISDPSFQPVLQRTPYTPIYRYNSYSAYNLYKPAEKVVKKTRQSFNICSRVCIQHTYLQAFLRFDPRLSRAFRTLFLLVVQFHSLFVTAFFYNFAVAKDSLAIDDIILLSVLTSCVTIPCIRITSLLLNHVGLQEFKYQFPMVYDEYMRRVEFEQLAQPLFQNADGADGADGASASASASATGVDTDDAVELGLLGWLCSFCKSNVIQEKEPQQKRAEVLKSLAEIIKKKYPKFQTHSIYWDLLPCHTLYGWLFVFSSFGWIGWCLQYLLLFAASHSTDIGTGILTSYATSELTTIFLTQPITILTVTGVIVLAHRYKKYLPWPLSIIGQVSTKNAIPSMYYFSNPLNHHTYTVLSCEFAHTLFLKLPSSAIGIDMLSAAPIKSILSHVNNEAEVSPDRRIQDLYYKMLEYYTNEVA